MTKNKEVNEKITVVVTGGGTGGHVYPAVAIAQRLKENDQVKKVYYIGCSKNMEADIAQKESIDFLSISISGMPRKKPLALLKWSLELVLSISQSIMHLKKIKPDVVFGTGGYVSGPVLIAAKILNIPFVLHDSDAHPGVVSRYLAPYAKAISVSFEDAKKFIKSKNIFINGNPIRSTLTNVDRQTAFNTLNLDSSKKTIFVMGGSQGAKSINDALMNILKNLIINHDFQIIHQTGKKNYDQYIQDLSKIWHDFSNYSAYIVKPYFENMEIPYAASDMAIARSGSLSISELNLVGLPSIMIPYPYAAADHQRFNAKAMEEAEASVYLDDTQCSADKLFKIIVELFNNSDKLTTMKAANLKLAKPQATANLVDIIIGAIR